MSVPPEYTRWSRITISLAVALVIVVGAGMWASVEFIRGENDIGNDNLARDVGIYIAMAVTAIITISMVLCALSVKNEYTLQCFALTSFIFSGVFLTIAGTQLRVDELSDTRKLFISFAFVLGILLFASCISAFRLSKLESFDGTIGYNKPTTNSKRGTTMGNNAV